MKKRILAMMLCLAMTLGMSSCGDNPNNDTDSTASSGNENKQTFIRFSWWGDTKRHEIYNKIADEFEKDNPDIKVEREANSWADYWDKLSVQVAGGNAPDVMGMHIQFASDYSSRGALLDLQPYLDDGTINTAEIEKSILETGRMNDVICMIPMAVTTASLIANKTLLEEYNIEYPDYNEDWTWDEFKAAGKAFKDATKGELWFTNDWCAGSINNLRYWARVKGEEAFTADGGIAFSEDTLAEWLNMWKELRDDGIIPDAATSNEDGTLALEQKIFTTRKCAMHNVPANQLYLYQQQMQDDEIILLRQPIANDGSQGAIIEGAHWSVYSKSKFPKQAAMFINSWTNDPEEIDLLRMDQGVPINKQLAEKISADLSASDKLCIDFVNAYMDVATGYTAPPAGASEIDTEYKNAGQAVAFGEKSVKEAAKEYVAKAKEIVDKNKK